MDRERRAELSLETLSIVDNGKYIINKNEYFINKIPVTKFYNQKYSYNEYNLPKNEKKVSITKETTLEAANRLIQEGKEVCILNFASATNPGGGFLKGSNAQEESICRSSNLYYELKKCVEYYVTNKNLGNPLYTDCIIYSKDITCFRDKNYNLCNPYILNVVTAPAVMNKIAMQRKEKEEKVLKTMENRIEKILKVMIENNQKNIVLGAFGSGAFQNNPDKISKIFLKLLIDKGYISCFDNVLFAIIDRDEECTNYNAYKTTFEKYL